MPHVNVWIRKDDYALWERIEDKPGFLRASIRTFSTTKNVDIAADLLKKTREQKLPPQVLGVLEAIPQVQSLKFCKHGYDPKLCKFAKNGKPCK